jgi:hypothetical protein
MGKCSHIKCIHMDVTGTIIPHSDFGNPECCGCLNAVIDGDQANIVCNECCAVVRSVPASELYRTLNEMELSLEFVTVVCPHCQFVNLFPGFTQMAAFVCQHCGQGVSIHEPWPG